MVETVVFSTDGGRPATASWDQTQVWDVASEKELRQLRGREDDGRSIAFSPDGDRVVTAWGPLARVWDLASGEKLQEFHGHENPVVGVAFSPAGDRVATASTDGTARLWDVASGDKLCRLRHEDNVGSVVLSPDGAGSRPPRGTERRVSGRFRAGRSCSSCAATEARSAASLSRPTGAWSGPPRPTGRPGCGRAFRSISSSRRRRHGSHGS